MRCSDRTASKNFIFRIAESKKNGRAFLGYPAAAAIPAVCASASVMITPGTRGFPGKCPEKIGSLSRNIVMHFAEIPGAQAINSVTKVKDGPCGKPKLRRDFDTPFVFFARLSCRLIRLKHRQVRDFVSTADTRALRPLRAGPMRSFRRRRSGCARKTK